MLSLVHLTSLCAIFVHSSFLLLSVFFVLVIFKFEYSSFALHPLSFVETNQESLRRPLRRTILNRAS